VSDDPAVFGRQVDYAEAALRDKTPNTRIWRLIAWNVPPVSGGLMAHLKMRASKKKPSTFWREYPGNQRAQVEAAIRLLKQANIHGIAKLVETPKRVPVRTSKQQRQPAARCSREGFGGRLNASPVRSSWRMRRNRR
jgi:hypothetical protein